VSWNCCWRRILCCSCLMFGHVTGFGGRCPAGNIDILARNSLQTATFFMSPGSFAASRTNIRLQQATRHCQSDPPLVTYQCWPVHSSPSLAFILVLVSTSMCRNQTGIYMLRRMDAQTSIVSGHPLRCYARHQMPHCWVYQRLMASNMGCPCVSDALDGYWVPLQLPCNRNSIQVSKRPCKLDSTRDKLVHI
jgi:hypothetical protein